MFWERVWSVEFKIYYTFGQDSKHAEQSHWNLIIELSGHLNVRKVAVARDGEVKDHSGKSCVSMAQPALSVSE